MNELKIIHILLLFFALNCAKLNSQTKFSAKTRSDIKRIAQIIFKSSKILNNASSYSGSDIVFDSRSYQNVSDQSIKVVFDKREFNFLILYESAQILGDVSRISSHTMELLFIINNNNYWVYRHGDYTFVIAVLQKYYKDVTLEMIEEFLSLFIEARYQIDAKINVERGESSENVQLVTFNYTDRKDNSTSKMEFLINLKNGTISFTKTKK